jgi:putative phosphoesterase
VTEVPSPPVADRTPDARVAIISDTHFPRRGVRLADEIVARMRDATAIIHGGDITSREGLDELRAIGPPVHAVLGNNDHELAGLLPEELSVTIAGVRIGMIHDAGARAGRLNRLRRLFPEHDAVVFGHSHIPLHEQADDGFQIFNPGSATEHRGRWPVHTMGELLVMDGEARFSLVDLES